MNGANGANGGNFVGFYLDVRKNGTTGTVDNLRIVTFLTIDYIGDVNMDCEVNFLDIAPFIAILSSGEFRSEADIDENGVVDFLDIAPFIAVLSGQ